MPPWLPPPLRCFLTVIPRIVVRRSLRLGLLVLGMLVLGVGVVKADLVTRVFLPVVGKAGVMGPTGTLVGAVRIGPLCPVEPCRQPTPDVYSSRRLLLQRADGLTVAVPLHPDGAFQKEVPVGRFSVTLSDCFFLGCGRALPVLITIAPGVATHLDINIDTGIR